MWVDCLPIDPIARYSEPLSPSSDLIDVVLHGLVAIDLHQILKFRVHDGCDVVSLIVNKIQDQSQFSAQLGIQHRSVQTSVGCILIYEQGAVMAMTQILGSDHASSALAQTSSGLEKFSVTSQVFTVIVVLHFQGFKGVGFSSYHLFDTAHVVMLEDEWVLTDGSV